jgi:hypothetical protein
MQKSETPVDTSKWSGEGEFTQFLIDHLRTIPQIAFVRVEDAPASRSEADYNFMSNEIFVGFATESKQERTRRWGIVPVRRTAVTKVMTIGQLETALGPVPGIGEPDYSDEGMLQYLRTERVVPPYQTRGYKIVELVRVYEFGAAARKS